MKSFRKVFIYGLKITYLPQKKAIKAEKKIRSQNFVGQMQWKRKKRYKNRDLAGRWQDKALLLQFPTPCRLHKFCVAFLSITRGLSWALCKTRLKLAMPHLSSAKPFKKPT